MEDGDRIISSKQLANLIGKSDRYVRQLVEGGTLKDTNPNGRSIKLLESESIQAWHQYDLEKNMPKASTLDDEKVLQDIRYKRTKADMMELELSELEGRMHSAEDVEAVVTDLVFTIRSALLSLPGQLAVDIVEAGSVAEASEIIKKTVYEILNELSRYKYEPEEYRRRVRERQGWIDKVTAEDNNEE